MMVCVSQLGMYVGIIYFKIAILSVCDQKSFKPARFNDPV